MVLGVAASTSAPSPGWAERDRLLFRDLPDHPARVPGGEHPLGDVPCDHAPGPDHGPRADADARAEDRTAADPDVRPDLDRLGGTLPPTKLGVHPVGRGVDLD